MKKDIQFLGKLLKSRLLGLVDHNLHHLVSDELFLRSLGVASSADLSVGSFGEANAEHS